MRLIGEEGLAVAVLPIGDNFTMGPDDAIIAAGFLNAQAVIPCHYNTWPLIEQDASNWAKRLSAETCGRPVVLEVGASHRITASSE